MDVKINFVSASARRGGVYEGSRFFILSTVVLRQGRCSSPDEATTSAGAGDKPPECGSGIGIVVARASPYFRRSKTGMPLWSRQAHDMLLHLLVKHHSTAVVSTVRGGNEASVAGR